MKLIFVFLLLGAAVPACASSLSAKPHDFVGTWHCGPSLMQGPGFTVTTSEKITRLETGTYVAHATTVIAVPGRPPLTVQDRSNGTWGFADGIIKTSVLQVEFVSASDPSVTKEKGQKAQDDQLKKKSIYESRVLNFTKNHYRTIPVNSTYKEAEVEISCKQS